MTVKELIEQLNKVEDKDKELCMYVDGYEAGIVQVLEGKEYVTLDAEGD